MSAVRYELDVQKDDTGVVVFLRAYGNGMMFSALGSFVDSGFNADGDVRAAIRNLRANRRSVRQSYGG